MNKKRFLVTISMLVLVLATAACSLNRQLPEAADEEAMVVEVKRPSTPWRPVRASKWT